MMRTLHFLQLTVVGETGATGVHAVCRVGLVLVSGVDNAIIHLRVPVENNARDFRCQASLAMRDRVLVRVELVLCCLSKQCE